MKFYLFVFQFLIVLLATAQTNILDRFTAQVVSGQVVLNWTISEGRTCNGIDLTRSVDGFNFSRIDGIEGVCGSNSEPVNYTLVDETPYFTTNLYRLEFGGEGTSKILSIEVLNYGTQGYLVRPNPFVDEAKIQFQNEQNETYRLMMYNIGGKKVLEKEGRNDFFIISSSDLKGGLYVFVLDKIDGSFSAQGKMIRLQ